MSAPLQRSFSIYLDLVRFCAAVLVCISHSNQRWLIEPILPASSYGPSSVIVFFVLSGFVIAYVTDTKERDWRSYAASRLSRVYSVAIPAIVLTVVLDYFGRQWLPSAYDYPFDRFVLRIAGSLLMANETWFISITSFSNVPYWSICYEVWYYAAFGALMFLPRRWAIPAACALALALGPKIVLLAPVWAMGVLLYRSGRLARISEPTGWFLAVSSVVGIVLFHALGVNKALSSLVEDIVGTAWSKELTFSKHFLGDYLLGLLVMLNFAGMRRISARFASIASLVERPIRALAAYTFTLYLLHQPLILFWAAAIRGDNGGYLYLFGTISLMAASVALVGAATENRRHVLTRRIKTLLRSLGKPERGELSMSPGGERL